MATETLVSEFGPSRLQLVRAWATTKGIGPLSARQVVCAKAAGELVLPKPSVKEILTRVPAEYVVALPAVDYVVASETNDYVVTVRSVKTVVAGSSDNRRCMAGAFRPGRSIGCGECDHRLRQETNS